MCENWTHPVFAEDYSIIVGNFSDSSVSGDNLLANMEVETLKVFFFIS